MKLLTLARDLQRRKARERQGCFVAEGVRSVAALLSSELAIIGLLVSEELTGSDRGAALLDAAAGRGVPVKTVSDADFGSAASTESPQGVLAVAEIPSVRLPEPGDSARYLLLDALQDPGNVGTIIRTAAALGVTATVALPGTVDLWNAKVVRSAMGASFHFPVMPTTWEEIDEFRKREGVTTWGADAAGSSLDTLRPPSRLALVVGNEGAGLSADVRGRLDQLVALPIGSIVESLNVAVATGIFLYQLRM